MSVKSEIKNKQSNIVALYPRLKKFKYPSTNHIIIVLFYRRKSGTVVYSTRPHTSVGHNSNSWDESRFEDFTGEITLSNV